MDGEGTSQGPQRGSRRVQSWIRLVINPLRDAIGYEIVLLDRGSLTWRFYERGLERIKRVGSYLADSRYALEDFVRFRPDVERPLSDHDQLLTEAVKAAADTHKATVARPELRALVMSKLAEYEKTHDPARRPSGAFDEDKLPDLVVDRMINDDRDVHALYTDAEFWNSNREAFMALATGGEFDRLRSATAALRDHDRVLLALLSDWHYQLVQEFDVEPV